MKYFLIATLMLLFTTLGFSKTITLTKENSITFNQPFTSGYVAKKQLEILDLLNTSSAEEFFLVLYSPGGSIGAGQLFIDTIRATGKNVSTLTIFSASMAYQTVQALGKRYILPSGTLMSHRGYVSGLSGQIPGELNKRVDMLESMINNMEKVSAARVKIPLKQYKKEIQNELWLIGEDSVKAGHADEVALAKCDNSLSGTHVESFRTIFGPVEVEFANCPLITGFISVKFGRREAVNFVENYYSNIMGHIQSKL